MGIKGLHGLLKSIQKQSHLKAFDGQTLGVDAYGWLHRGAVACAVDLVLDKPTTKHIEFVLGRVRMLQYFNIVPYLVFDGNDLPSKLGTDENRRQRRQESKALGIELQRKGRVSQAHQELQKAVDVTPYMARQLIEELKKMNVQYIVAPYEADAQLVYLEREAIIDGIISEDSDMLAFGAKKLISKLDQHGDCVIIDRADFTSCREVSLNGWTDADFRHMCILSGCDYLPNIPRLGLKTAYRCIRKYRDVEKTLRMLQFEGKYHVPADYLQNFKQAELTFLYQRVFCPKAGRLVTLTRPEDSIDLEGLTFIGSDMEPETAVGVASGDLDPATKEIIRLEPLAPGEGRNNVDRRQTLGSSAELKPVKTIKSFYTPKRIPLAELDPNSLTPSPSRQRLLNRHANSSWEARYAPLRLNNAGSPLPRDDRISTPLVRSAGRTTFLARAAKLSNFQPSKRPRLCSESEQSDGLDCRSRFFASDVDNVKSDSLKALKPKRSRKSTLDIFSDEVVENAMPRNTDSNGVNADGENTVALHETDQSGQTRHKEYATLATHTSQSHSETQDEQHPAEGLNADRSVSAESDPNLFQIVLNHHVEKQNSSLLSKYIFESAPRDNLKEVKPLGERALKAMRSTSNLRMKSTSSENPIGKRLTPLQRLGRNALARSQSLSALSTAEFSGVGNEALVSCSQDSSVKCLVVHRGSEDMLAPDSEGEDVDRMNIVPQPRSLKQFTLTAI